MVRAQASNSTEERKEFQEFLVSVDRVTKVVKGGRILAFSALVVVGDGKGNIGMAKGKAKEVPVAVQKAVERAKRSMRHVRIVDDTIPHEVLSKHGASKILLIPARSGAGLIAGGAARIVLNAVGIKNIVSKSYGSRNPKNLVRAVFNALTSFKSM
jgi:small subunit ribosomal protein S5